RPGQLRPVHRLGVRDVRGLRLPRAPERPVRPLLLAVREPRLPVLRGSDEAVVAGEVAADALHGGLDQGRSGLLEAGGERGALTAAAPAGALSDPGSCV